MLRPETLAIHAGRAARVAGEPLNPPLVPASNFYEAGYAREQGSPGWAPLEAAMGALEGGTAIAFGSGMAAISAVLETLPAGAKVVGPDRAQLGALPGALEAWLALRGLRTLPARLEIAQRTAQVLAERLSERHVVYYPGLPGDAGHERATRLMAGYGAMLAFEHADADAVCGRVRVITHAKSLGGVESLIERRAPGLLRLSVGCEHVEDLWDDLERAL